jgi:hypothetical protein
MELTIEELEKITEYADMLLSIQEIAIMLDKDILEFTEEFQYVKRPLYLTYSKAVILRKIKLRIPVLKMAEMGSPNAESIAQTFLTDQQININET